MGNIYVRCYKYETECPSVVSYIPRGVKWGPWRERYIGWWCLDWRTVSREDSTEGQTAKHLCSSTLNVWMCDSVYCWVNHNEHALVYRKEFVLLLTAVSLNLFLYYSHVTFVSKQNPSHRLPANSGFGLPAQSNSIHQLHHLTSPSLSPSIKMISPSFSLKFTALTWVTLNIITSLKIIQT